MLVIATVSVLVAAMTMSAEATSATKYDRTFIPALSLSVGYPKTTKHHPSKPASPKLSGGFFHHKHGGKSAGFSQENVFQAIRNLVASVPAIASQQNLSFTYNSVARVAYWDTPNRLLHRQNIELRSRDRYSGAPVTAELHELSIKVHGDDRYLLMNINEPITPSVDLAEKLFSQQSPAPHSRFEKGVKLSNTIVGSVINVPATLALLNGTVFNGGVQVSTALPTRVTEWGSQLLRAKCGYFCDYAWSSNSINFGTGAVYTGIKIQASILTKADEDDHCPIPVGGRVPALPVVQLSYSYGPNAIESILWEANGIQAMWDLHYAPRKLKIASSGDSDRTEFLVDLCDRHSI